MKIMTIFLLVGIFSVSAKVYSQDAKVSINLENKSTKDVFSAIKSQTDYSFWYDTEDVNVDESVSIKVKNEKVYDVLKDVLKNQNVDFTLIGNHIVIAKKGTLDIALEKQQQSKKQITGTVYDENGDPIIGANVIEKGSSSNGTITDVDGKFKLNISDNSVLMVSYIGYSQKEVDTEGKNTFVITLIEDTKALEEVVVVGYGTQKKESLTSAITSVNTDLLESRSIAKVSSALQGITPGVEIRQSSGRPGYSTFSFDIRGSSMGTFSNNNALVLIDGIVADINDVNPNDIENISVLKDAAAASIYGSRATGGVVLITTKKGTKDKITVNYTGTFGVEHNLLSTFKDKVIDTQTWMRANNEGRINDGGSAAYSDEVISQYDGSDPLKPATSQWFDWIKDYTPQYTQDVSIRGGTEKVNIYASAGYVSQEGLLYNDDYDKWSMQTNVNWKVTNRLNIGFNVFYSKEDITRPLGTVSSSFLRPILNPPKDVFQYPNGIYNKGTLNMSGFNAIYAMKEGGNTEYDYDKYRLSADLKYKIMDGLSLNYIIASKNTHTQANIFYKLLDKYDSEGNVIGTSTINGKSYSTAQENWSTTRYLSNLIKLDYDKKIEDHAITAMIGFQTEENRYDFITARGYNFINNELREVGASIGSGTDLYGTTSANEWAIASLIGRATYSYKDRYLLEFTMRYDGSSRFSKENRWAFFPSVSAAWRITEENFMKNAEWINNLKLRASYGQLGNQGSTLYPFATIVSTGTWVFGDATSTTTTVGTTADNNLTWEKKTTTNIGLDWGFLGQRLTGSFDWFYDRTKDIIGKPTVPTTFGASAPVQNTYTIDNRGWEFETRWTDKIGDVKYYAGFNISDARDNVVSLGSIGSTDPRYTGGKINLSSGSGVYVAEGKARNSLYLYETDGLFVDQEEIDNYVAPSSKTKPGDIKFIDRNGDGVIDSNDRYLSDKTTTPHYIYGINFGAEWKGIDVSVVFNGVGERWAYRNGDGHYMTGNRLTFSMFTSNYENRWTAENPDKWADQPRLTNNNWISGEFCTMFSSACEYHLRNMKYIRLKNLQIGYTFPKNLIKKIRLSNVRVYFTGENLFYIAPGYKENLDPEAYWNTSDGGASSVYYGPSEVLSGGLSVTF